MNYLLSFILFVSFFMGLFSGVYKCYASPTKPFESKNLFWFLFIDKY